MKMATETLEQKSKSGSDILALFFPETEEGKKVFLSFFGAEQELGLKVEYFFSEVEKRPILLVDDEKYVGGGEILKWLDEYKASREQTG